MIKWIKNLFKKIESKPYEGSSKNFIELYREISKDLEDDLNLKIVLKKISLLLVYTKTIGDSDLIKQLYAKMDIKIAIETIRLKELQKEFQDEK